MEYQKIINIAVIAHVDAGKSTTCGNILVRTGQVDERTVEKYEREAKENNRESWYYAYVMDVKGLYHTGKNLFIDTTDKSTTYYPVTLCL